MIVDFFLIILSILVFLYDFITFPFFLIFAQPWKKRADLKKREAWYPLESKGDYIGYIHDRSPDHEAYKELVLKNKVDTVTKVWDNAAKLHAGNKCLGTRKVMGEEEEKQDNGKVFKKLLLGEYEWMTTEEAHSKSTKFGSGLVSLGLQAGQPVAIYGDTRSEWILSALGAFSQSIVVTTLYTNLGEEAVAHGINETEVSLVITSHTLLPKFKTLLEKCPKVTHVIYMEDQNFKTSKEGLSEVVEFLSFDSVVSFGEATPAPPNPPAADDVAIIMYTSGSTGVPKGVMVSHQNIVSCATCIVFLHDFKKTDPMYIAYLPLAHILELTAECTMMLLGIPIGYSSPNTITDLSTAIRRGDKGDATLLRPTVMCIVPLILDRIFKNLKSGIAKKGTTFEKIFNFCYQQKVKWVADGYPTPLLDRLVFNKLSKILGGRVDLMLVGSAPLSPSTQEFVRTTICANLVQGYTMTETSCSGTCQVPGTTETGLVGGPMAGMEIRLVDWEEGNYRITDNPPRGELVLGGISVSKGYYKNQEKTDEDFFMEDGKQFFRSGDIGEMRSDGAIRLIDRKKDLVKLQLGEFVSLGKVEAQMKTNSLVENICVYADSFKTHTVALVVPVKEPLEKVAKGLKKSGDLTLEELCVDEEVVKEVVRLLGIHGKNNGLEKFEIPTVMTLCPEVWMPESGLVTAAFKLKRKALQTHYQPAIDAMYGKV